MYHSSTLRMAEFTRYSSGRQPSKGALSFSAFVALNMKLSMMDEKSSQLV